MVIGGERLFITTVLWPHIVRVSGLSETLLERAFIPFMRAVLL